MLALNPRLSRPDILAEEGRTTVLAITAVMGNRKLMLSEGTFQRFYKGSAPLAVRRSLHLKRDNGHIRGATWQAGRELAMTWRPWLDSPRALIPHSVVDAPSAFHLGIIAHSGHALCVHTQRRRSDPPRPLYLASRLRRDTGIDDRSQREAGRGCLPAGPHCRPYRGWGRAGDFGVHILAGPEAVCDQGTGRGSLLQLSLSA